LSFNPVGDDLTDELRSSFPLELSIERTIENFILNEDKQTPDSELFSARAFSISQFKYSIKDDVKSKDHSSSIFISQYNYISPECFYRTGLGFASNFRLLTEIGYDVIWDYNTPFSIAAVAGITFDIHVNHDKKSDKLKFGLSHKLLYTGLTLRAEFNESLNLTVAYGHALDEDDFGGKEGLYVELIYALWDF
jgi:hypothetical protein